MTYLDFDLLGIYFDPTKGFIDFDFNFFRINQRMLLGFSLCQWQECEDNAKKLEVSIYFLFMSWTNWADKDTLDRLKKVL